MVDSNTPQFDSYLGGCQSLPLGINVSEFIKNRMEEVVMLTETIKESPFKGQTFQRLPKHMRRRQMSHYIKRLPKRLQKPNLKCVKDALPAVAKRPSRKYRRRPQNLLTEYNRRQKESIWLETHIWHAKRFHMIKKWGYKLPNHSVNKSFKACYRAVSEHCLLNDISFYNCIELKGSVKKLLEGLKHCTSSDCGLTFGAKMYLEGSREGSVTLFHPNSYPFKVIGNVTFMWQPVIGGGEERSIWIWVHPLMHNEVVECFKALFNLIFVNKVGKETEETINSKREVQIMKNCNVKRKKKKTGRKILLKEIEAIKVETKNISFIHEPKYTNENDSVTMFLLKDTLNRFRLTGPLSQAIISQAFDVPPVSTVQKKTTEVEVDTVEVQFKKPKLDDVEIDQEVKTAEIVESWWVQYYKDDDCRRNWESQKNFYDKLSHFSKPTDAASRMILSLVIGDPRLNVPPKKEKAVPIKTDLCQLHYNSVKPCLSQGPIWNPDIRAKVSASKLTTNDINEAKAKKIVPGFVTENIARTAEQTRIPILLVQRPGQSEGQFGKLGLGSGWDVIVPAGFGMPIWLALVFRGARTGGLREFLQLQLECSNLNNYLPPDSAAGETENRCRLQELTSYYFKLPPCKRPNFIKLGVLSPFYFLWKILTIDWILHAKPKIKNLEISQQKFCVLRNNTELRKLSDIVGKFSKFENVNLDKLFSSDINYLVPVVIECLERGNPADLALICLPDEADLKSKSNPVEPSHLDESKTLRMILKKKHLKLLKSLSRKRRKRRIKIKENVADNVLKTKDKSSETIDSPPVGYCLNEYKAKMRFLWTPDAGKINSIINSCSRMILGFVVKGGFSFSKSVGGALGFISLLGLVHALKTCRKNNSELLVLVRNTNHSQYRFAKLKIALV